jgi:hypothetical protein
MIPARYGSLHSLRELAADTQLEHYFQAADVERYAKILGQRMTRAVGMFLESQGYSVVEFMQQAASVFNNFGNVNYGTMNGSAMGSGSRADHNTVTANNQQEGT